VRDGGCAVPGCDLDPSRCEAHHITYWEHHGETSISNMVLLCSQHHHMVHEGRWRIERNTDLEPGHLGYVTLVAPARTR
jgi:predicted restriction endonuclease